MIRIYLSHQQLPVRLVGVGRGRSYADAGFTHRSGNDAEIVEKLGNISVYSPEDWAVRINAYAAYVEDRPIYVRLER